MLETTAWLVIVVTASTWSSTDIRMSKFPDILACKNALTSMRIEQTKPVGDKAGMTAYAFCTNYKYGVDHGRSFYSDTSEEKRKQ